MRALQLPQPILLEGSPGVGKTSLISALAKASGHSLVRINLSEQTDIADLLGCDLPVPADKDASDGGACTCYWLHVALHTICRPLLAYFCVCASTARQWLSCESLHSLIVRVCGGTACSTALCARASTP